MEVKPLTIRLKICVEPDGDEFHAYCPALKGLHTSGRTKEETLENARDAAIAYLQSLIQHGEPIPVGTISPPHTRGVPIFSGVCAQEYVEDLALLPA